MFSLTSFTLIKSLLWGSPTARLVTLAATAFLGAWIYGQYKYWQGGRQAKVEVIEKANEVSKQRTKKIRRWRAGVKRGTARDRLLKYANPPGNR